MCIMNGYLYQLYIGIFDRILIEFSSKLTVFDEELLFLYYIYMFYNICIFTFYYCLILIVLSYLFWVIEVLNCQGAGSYLFSIQLFVSIFYCLLDCPASFFIIK